jgi:hypothetical protein
MDIICVQEMRWIGMGTIKKKDWIIFYSFDTKEHKFGTGFVIHKRVKHLVMSFQPNLPICAAYRLGQNYSTIV